jgi:hypothetical protein
MRINMWSGPRNISTALMYSFAQRPDTRIVDEPLYAHYLRVTNAPHPGADEVLATMENDGARVIQDIILGPCDRPILFMKQMAHHLIELQLDFLAVTTNVLLIRSPEEMLPSLAQNLPAPTLRDTGLAIQSDLYRRLCTLGQNPPVLDAKAVLLDPEDLLGRLCDHLQIPFDKAMLRWPPGPRPENGIWAKYWYHNLHRSSGFEPYRKKSAPFPPQLTSLLEECRPHYEQLAKVAL